MVNHKYVHSPFPAFVTFQLVVFLISKKKILLKKARETQKVHGSEQWKKEATRQKQPLIYSNRRNKIRKGRTIQETPTTRPIKEGLLAKL